MARLLQPTRNVQPARVRRVLHLSEDARSRVCIAEAAASDGKIQSGRNGLLVEGAKLSFAFLLQRPEAFDDAFLLLIGNHIVRSWPRRIS